MFSYDRHHLHLDFVFWNGSNSDSSQYQLCMFPFGRIHCGVYPCCYDDCHCADSHLCHGIWMDRPIQTDSARRILVRHRFHSILVVNVLLANPWSSCSVPPLQRIKMSLLTIFIIIYAVVICVSFLRTLDPDGGFNVWWLLMTNLIDGIILTAIYCVIYLLIHK